MRTAYASAATPCLWTAHRPRVQPLLICPARWSRGPLLPSLCADAAACRWRLEEGCPCLAPLGMPAQCRVALSWRLGWTFQPRCAHCCTCCWRLCARPLRPSLLRSGECAAQRAAAHSVSAVGELSGLAKIHWARRFLRGWRAARGPQGLLPGSGSPASHTMLLLLTPLHRGRSHRSPIIWR